MVNITSVSIHAPRAGCDMGMLKLVQMSNGFNSRTPCGVRPLLVMLHSLHVLFQFTHPVRGATSDPPADCTA